MRIYSGPVSFTPASADRDITILGTISEGRMFRVHKARQGTKYVILKTAMRQDTMSVEILRREYDISKTLIHPCIVSTLGFEETIPAIVTEYIEGLTLDEYMASAPTTAQRKAVLGDILDALDYLHHRGVFHNDLKPDNIIVTPNGAARIIDFGLSGSDDSIYKGCAGGSEGYTAPEVMEGKGDAGAASDIYSLGRLMNLIFGSGRYRSIAGKCSRKNPELRFQSIADIRAAMARRDRLPIISAGAALLAVIFALILQPKIHEAGADDRYKSVEKRISDEMAGPFLRAAGEMSAQKYGELADIICQDWYMGYLHYLDSLEKAHPMTGNGIIPPEIIAASDNQRSQMAVLDSIIKSKPSIKTLPAAQQEALMESMNVR